MSAPVLRGVPRDVSAAHPCPVPACGTPCSPGHAVCRLHWIAIPGHLREPLVDAFRARTANPSGYLAATAAAVRLARDYAPRADSRADPS